MVIRMLSPLGPTTVRIRALFHGHRLRLLQASSLTWKWRLNSYDQRFTVLVVHHVAVITDLNLGESLLGCTLHLVNPIRNRCTPSSGTVFYLCQTAQFLNIAFLVQGSFHELPTIWLVSSGNSWRARAAAVVGTAFDDEVLKVGQIASNLVRNHTKRVIPTFPSSRYRSRSRASKRML